MEKETIKNLANRKVDGGKTSGLAADTAHNLFDRGVALDHRQQTAVEDRAHTIAHGGLLDRGIAGALEDQTVDRPRRYEQLGDRPPPAKAGAAAGGATD